MPVVRIDWTEGRTDKQKKELIEYFTEKIHEVTGVDKTRIIILINDFPKASVGLNGKPVSEL